MGYRILTHNSDVIGSQLDFVIPVIRTGTGAGVSTLQLTTNTDTTISTDGAGIFYDDAAGTVNPQTSKAFTSGATRTFYFKLTSGSADIRIANGQSYITRFNAWTSSTNAASIYQMNLSSLPSVMTSFFCTGSNTITGNLSSLPSVMTSFFCTGSNTITDYTSPKTWATNYNYFFIRQAVGSGLSSTEVDNLLIDMSAATWGGSSRTLDVRGVNAARTSASNAAVATLLSKSVNVLTN